MQSRIPSARACFSYWPRIGNEDGATPKLCTRGRDARGTTGFLSWGTLVRPREKATEEETTPTADRLLTRRLQRSYICGDGRATKFCDEAQNCDKHTRMTSERIDGVRAGDGTFHSGMASGETQGVRQHPQTAGREGRGVHPRERFTAWKAGCISAPVNPVPSGSQCLPCSMRPDLASGGARQASQWKGARGMGDAGSKKAPAQRGGYQQARW